MGIRTRASGWDDHGFGARAGKARRSLGTACLDDAVAALHAHEHRADLDVVLLRAYARCIDGQADIANRRIADVLDPMPGSPPDTASLECWRQRHSGRSSHSRVTPPTRGGMHRYASGCATHM